ncbi:unnamed protein product [Symbiodinium sp. CCMP2592]|nr:unnamed protein product [Symbiodinium sp. CCMP2592]
MSFKRARAAEQSRGSSFAVPDACQDPLIDEGSNIEAAKKFRRLLIEKYLDGSATATDTCQLAYWHNESGGGGAEDLALHPRCHLAKEFPEPIVEMVSVPMYLKKSVGRVIVQHPTRVTSAMIRKEMIDLGILGSESPAAVQDFLKPDEEFGDLYERHCITIEALREGFKREHIVPLSVYFDGVQYSKNENFLGLSELCGCGCRGWCSVFPLLEAFKQDLTAKHADLRLPIIDFKADWAALVEIAALRTWSHSLHACPCCLVKKSEMDNLEGFTARTCAFPLFDEKKYEATLAKNFKVWNLTLTMLAEKALKCKAAETHGLLGFAVETLEKYKTVLQNCEQSHMFDLLLRAGRAAEAFDRVMASHTRVFPTDACDSLHQSYHRFIVLCSRAGVPLLPKGHLMFHLVAQASVRGNPRCYSTYIDESYNGAIAKVCRSVHRRNWALAVYRKLEMLESMLSEEF